MEQTIATIPEIMTVDYLFNNDVIRLPAWDTQNGRYATQGLKYIDIYTNECYVEHDFECIKEWLNRNNINNLKTYSEFKKVINQCSLNNKTIPILWTNFKKIKSAISTALKMYPEYLRPKYKTTLDEIIIIISKKLKESSIYIYSIKNELFAYFDEIVEKEKTKIKANKQIVNKKYYEKKKELFETLKIEKPDDETVEEKINKIKEIKANKQLANKKYYEKKKELFETLKIEKPDDETVEEKINKIKEIKANANKKYYEKKKELLQIQPRKLLTPEEKIERQKIAKHKYYEKIKSSNKTASA